MRIFKKFGKSQQNWYSEYLTESLKLDSTLALGVPRKGCATKLVRL